MWRPQCASSAVVHSTCCLSKVRSVLHGHIECRRKTCRHREGMAYKTDSRTGKLKARIMLPNTGRTETKKHKKREKPSLIPPSIKTILLCNARPFYPRKKTFDDLVLIKCSLQGERSILCMNLKCIYWWLGLKDKRDIFYQSPVLWKFPSSPGE